jgi:antibiotic biosynthesis monooxygenase (ABM) superfamily enzyme
VALINSKDPNKSPGRKINTMLVNIIHFPPIKAGKDAEFREWFIWSSQEYAKHKGFISRKLLLPRDGDNYIGLVEHESYETFMTMHTSPTQAEANQRVKPLLDGRPTPEFYTVVLP